MMTLRERLDCIEGACRSTHCTPQSIREVVERHLREYGEEAVAVAEARARCPNTASVSEGTRMVNYNDPCAEDLQARTAQAIARPTAEDALRAINAMTYVNMLDIPVFRQGLADLIAGRRDTPAAKAIVGKGD